MSPVLLDVNELCIKQTIGNEERIVVYPISFQLRAGKSLGILGESGAGKSIISKALMDILPPRFSYTAKGLQVLGQPHKQAIKKLRGRLMNLVFQDAMNSLNPVLTIGCQLFEVSKRVKRRAFKVALEKILFLLDIFSLGESILNAYPHQLSGGMRQRVLLIMAMLNQPRILLADEPTTALDPVMREHTINFIRKQQQEQLFAFLCISHDFGVIQKSCDDVIVLYGGRVVEVAPTSELMHEPFHPYTKALIASSQIKLLPHQDRIPTVPVQAFDGRTGCCPLAHSCKFKQDICQRAVPQLSTVSMGRQVACFFPLNHKQGERSA